MDNLHIPAENKKPAIEFEQFSGSLKIGGRSSIENPGKFYEQVIEWLDAYCQSPAVETTFKMEMEYFNSSSAKHLMKIFRVLEKAHVDGKTNVHVEWHHSEHDDSMMEAGEDYASMLKIPFIYVEEEDD